jgi:DNA-directed RNA polymerase subunit M/transcription elongation factor TFIIS
MDKYNRGASKMIKDMTTYSELSSGMDHFDLAIWNDYKVAQQMTIEFACRQKEMVEGEYTCRKCGGNKVYTQSIQTRSADEAADVYALCANSECKSRPWKVG